jgi:hypothetical protein
MRVEGQHNEEHNQFGYHVTVEPAVSSSALKPMVFFSAIEHGSTAGIFAAYISPDKARDIAAMLLYYADATEKGITWADSLGLEGNNEAQP